MRSEQNWVFLVQNAWHLSAACLKSIKKSWKAKRTLKITDVINSPTPIFSSSVGIHIIGYFPTGRASHIMSIPGDDAAEKDES